MIRNRASSQGLRPAEPSVSRRETRATVPVAVVSLLAVLLLPAAAVAPHATARAATSVGVVVRMGEPALALAEQPGLVAVPHDGLRVELWSDPEAGSLVHPGAFARLYMRPNAGCYLTLLSVDTEGRVSVLFPSRGDDGWVRAGATSVVPSPHAGYDLVFTDPPGIEYVYAIASLYPVRDRYPGWAYDDGSYDWEPEDEPEDTWLTGWVVGDPFYRIQAFCRDLVPYPSRADTYDSAYLYFHVGRRVEYPRYLCADCHAGAILDPYGPTCPAVRIRCGKVAATGWIDFRVTFVPRYTYEVTRTWRPRLWKGRRWDGPDGRWVWSSAEGRDRLRRSFEDAPRRRPADAPAWRRGPTVRPDRPASKEARPSRPGRFAKPAEPNRQRESGARPSGPLTPLGWMREPIREDGAEIWRRAHEERLESTLTGTGTAAAAPARAEKRVEARAKKAAGKAPAKKPETRAKKPEPPAKKSDAPERKSEGASSRQGRQGRAR